MLRYRLRSSRHVRTRFFHLLDSQVCLAVLKKHRNSSHQLQSVLRRIDVLLLAGLVAPIFGYVRSEVNPADEPSRW